MVAYQEGELKFRVEDLPQAVQFSSVNRILVDDVNGDQYPDLILGGNDFEYQPQFGQLDAGFFNLLLGTATGFLEVEHSGVKGTGMVRSMNELTIKNQKHLLIGINNEKAQVYKFR